MSANAHMVQKKNHADQRFYSVTRQWYAQRGYSSLERAKRISM